jgi:adenylate kinase
LILFGPPGSGKGTQATLLRKAFGVAHISTGDMLRERAASGDPLGAAAAALMKSGGLVPDQIVNKMVEERIEEPDCAAGFILDGFPRTVDQARLLAGLLEAKNISPVVVYLKVDYNVIIARLSGRRLCPTCGALYSVASNAPTIAQVCDRCGSKLVIREDDREEVVTERLKAYERQTTPVLACLKAQGYRLLEIDGADGRPQEIAKRIQAWVEGKSVEGKSVEGIGQEA